MTRTPSGRRRWFSFRKSLIRTARACGAAGLGRRTAGTQQCQRWVERLTAEPKSGSTPICFSMMLTTG